VRARAVENLAYVIAAAQGGYHLNGRETYGDSMIVNPWGEVLDRLARGSGVVLADLDRRYFEHTRSRFPSIQHGKYARMTNTLDIARRTCWHPPAWTRPTSTGCSARFSRTAWIMRPLLSVQPARVLVAGRGPGQVRLGTTSNRASACAR